MFDETEYNRYYRGDDLLNINKKLLFDKLTEVIKQEQGKIAYLLACKEKHSKEYDQFQNRIYELRAYEANPDEQIDQLQKKKDIIDAAHKQILLAIKPLFHELFTQVATEIQGGIEYNEELRTDVWYDLIFGYRPISGVTDGARDQYRNDSTARSREARHQKRIQKNSEKRKQEKEKIRLPQNHQLLNEQSYPKLKKIMWTHLDKVVSTYQQKFLKDIKNLNQTKELIDNYFLFIFIQMLIQSKIIFDTKRPRPTPFFQQVVDDCLLYIQEKYNISPAISIDAIKKKFFSTIDENTKPLELIYKNYIEEDLIVGEEYLNTHFFTSNQTSVDQIRREIMMERKQNIERMNRGWEALNPLYHLAKEKKEKVLATIEILEHHKAENNLIEDMLKQLQESLKKTEEDMKNNVVFEENSIITRNSDSITKLQQQQLKRYKVPVQYRKIFGVIINRLNNFYQIKSILAKKSTKHFNEIFDQLINSKQEEKDILYFINGLITIKKISEIFDEKWSKKQKEKIRRIQSFCVGTNKITAPSKKKKEKSMEGQGLLNL